MPRKSTPIQVVIHYPKTEEGQRELAKRVAGVHADMVNQYLKKLDCPTSQKLQLLNAVIETAHEQQRKDHQSKKQKSGELTL